MKRRDRGHEQESERADSALDTAAVTRGGLGSMMSGLAIVLVVLGAALLVVKSLATRRFAVRSGSQALRGRVATVRTVPAPVGQVQLDGALWRARMWDLDEEGVPLAEGTAGEQDPEAVLQATHLPVLVAPPAAVAACSGGLRERPAVRDGRISSHTTRSVT